MMGPTLLKTIPSQIINEQAAFGPFNLTEYIESTSETPKLRFQAELMNGDALPRGLICTSDGVVTGIPAKGTQGNYEVKVTVEDEAGPLVVTFILTIKPNLGAEGETRYLDQLKTQVWQALEQKLPVPDFSDLYNQPISILDVYYLLERWGTLKIWDAFNLDPMSALTPLTLEGASEHYHVYDCGSCLIAAPKDLFSHERTIEDGLQTARALAREVYKRGWTVELSGLSKFTRAAWIEITRLGELSGKFLDVINFEPSGEDVKIYEAQVIAEKMRGG